MNHTSRVCRNPRFQSEQNRSNAEPPSSALWGAYARARDLISEAKPQTMAGVLAKAEAANAEAMSSGEEHWEGSVGAGWACNIVNDLLRLAGRK
jgi:hypothetical protein